MPSESSQLQHPARCVGVTVRTPAGFCSAFAVDRATRAQRLTERAIDFFVDRHKLEPGRFGLGLVRDDGIVDLEPHELLMRQGVDEGDVFHLFSRD